MARVIRKRQLAAAAESSKRLLRHSVCYGDEYSFDDADYYGGSVGGDAWETKSAYSFDTRSVSGYDTWSSGSTTSNRARLSAAEKIRRRHLEMSQGSLVFPASAPSSPHPGRRQPSVRMGTRVLKMTRRAKSFSGGLSEDVSTTSFQGRVVQTPAIEYGNKLNRFRRDAGSAPNLLNIRGGSYTSPVKPDRACLGCSTAAGAAPTVTLANISATSHSSSQQRLDWNNNHALKTHGGSTSALYDVAGRLGSSFDVDDDDDRFSVLTTPASAFSTLERSGSSPHHQLRHHRRRQQRRRQLFLSQQNQLYQQQLADQPDRGQQRSHHQTNNMESALTPLISPLCQHLKDNHPEVFEQMFGFQLATSSSSIPNSFDRERESISSGSLKMDTGGKKKRPKSGHLGSIKPPLIQRPEGAPITMKGWLYKQGSDGLMLWRKRWFVLSEFCLFYYKGPEEGKVLGSILLPSYKISPCSGDEKFFRKFAFRIEHLNMRTYYFAAENKDSMTLWMNALSLASIMHSKEGKIDEHPTAIGDELDGGFRSTQPRRPKSMDAGRTLNRSWGDRNSAATTSPPPDHRLNSSYDSELSPAPPGRPPGGPRQPLYANAPPKPKRIVDWENGQIGPDYAYGPIPGMGTNLPNHNPADRRTPEAYARSRIDYDTVNGGFAKNNSSKYGSNHGATTPLSGTATMPPPSTAARKQSPYASAPVVPRYGIDHNHASPFVPPPSSHHHRHNPQQGYNNYQTHNHHQHAPPPRPHSADFLDYEPSPPPTQHRSRYIQHQQMQRPKSSIDPRPPSTNDYWSEEAAYAEKMRQASAFNTTRPPSVKPPSSLPLKSIAGASSPQQNGGIHPNYSSQTFPSRGAAAVNGNVNGRDHSAPNTNRSYSPVDFGQNGFLRSASARLPRHKQPRDQELQSAASASYLDDAEADGSRSVDRKKLQQREESMKRLLEWKQRMLQSPLTRKAHSPKPESPKPTHQGSDKYRRQALHEVAQTRDIPNGVVGGSPHPTSTAMSTQNGSTGPPQPGNRQQRPTSLEVTPLAGEPNHRKTQRVKGDGMVAQDPQQRWSTGSKPHSHRNQAYASFSSDDEDADDPEMGIGMAAEPAFVPKSPGILSHQVLEQPTNGVASPSSRSSHSQYQPENQQQQQQAYQQQFSRVPDYVNIAHLTHTPNFVAHEIRYDKTESYTANLEKRVDYQNGAQHQRHMPDVFKAPRVEYCYEGVAKPVTVDVTKHDGKQSSPDRSPGSLTDDFSTGKYSDSGYDTVRFDSVSREDLRDGSTLGRSRHLDPSRVGADVWRTSGDGVPAKNLVQQRIKAFEVKGALEEQQQQQAAQAGAKYSPTATEPEIVAAFSGTSGNYPPEVPKRPLVPPKPGNRTAPPQHTPASDAGQIRLSMVETMERSILEGSDSEEDEVSLRRRRQPPPPPVPKGWLVDDEEPEGLVDEGDEIQQQEQEQNEDHYLPMTPQKQTRKFPNGVVAANATPSQTVVMESLMKRKYEESTYVDMTEDGILYTSGKSSSVTTATRAVSVFENEPMAGRFGDATGGEFAPYPMESPKYCEIPEENQHYELLSRSYTGGSGNGSASMGAMGPEPIYNEVAASEYSAAKLSSGIPDIVPAKSGFESDSASDADDEASKDLDAMDKKSKNKKADTSSSSLKKSAHKQPSMSSKRFSLSDTFRPASYYLPKASGNGVNVDDSDNGSSDSDLVSPPPIPSSPPPLEDLREGNRASSSTGTLSRASKRSPRISEVTNPPQDPLKAPEPPGKLRITLNAARMDVEKRKSLEAGPPSATPSGTHSDPYFTLQQQSSQLETPRSPLETELNYSYYRVYGDHQRPGPNVNTTMPPLSSQTRAQMQHPPPPPSTTSSTAARSRHARTNSTASSDSNRSGAPYYYSDLLEAAGGVHPSANPELTTDIQEKILRSLTSRQRNQLNNYRLDQEANGKRSDVGRRVNQIANTSADPVLQTSAPPYGAANGLSSEEIRRTVQYYEGSKAVEFDAKNVYASGAFQKRSVTPDPSVFWGPVSGGANRRARSLEGLLDRDEGGDFAATSFQTPIPTTAVAHSRQEAMAMDIWEEDSLWRENLRRESLRHAQSVEGLDVASGADGSLHSSGYYPEAPTRPAANARVTRDVIYVNDLAAGDVRERVNQRRPPPVPQKPSAAMGASQTASAPRPVQRQHFLGESLPPTSESSFSRGTPAPDVLPPSRPTSARGDVSVSTLTPMMQQVPSSVPASMGRVGGRLSASFPGQNYENLNGFPPPSGWIHPPSQLNESSSAMAKANGSAMSGLHQQQQQQQQQKQTPTPLSKSEIEELFPKMKSVARTPVVPENRPDRYYQPPPPWQPPNQGIRNPRPQSAPAYPHPPMPAGAIRPPMRNPHHQQMRGYVPPPPAMQQSHHQPGKSLANLARTPSPYTAGDLLGKSHEELVLLLLNLRRESASLLRGIRQTRADMEAQLGLMKGPRSDVAVRLYEDLSCRLRDLERRFEAQKPLLNLVTNMVKLGSLYDNADNASFSAQVARERIEFQRRVQERRATSAERPAWDENSPDHKELEDIVSRVYRMDDFLHAEAMNVYALREDKTLLEGALNNVREKLKSEGASQRNAGLTAGEMERLKRHQHLLEQELSFVKNQLNNSSTKLEDAESENMRLEHELVVLRQKVLQALKHATSLQAHSIANQDLESELVRVQQLTKDLQRRRMDLSHQVKTITERSLSSSHLNQLAAQDQLRPSPTGVAGAGPIPMKKKQSNSWYETDLDSMVTMDSAREQPYTPYTHMRRASAGSGAPPYANGPIGYDPYGNQGGWGFAARGRPHSSSQESLATYQYRQGMGSAASWGKHSVGNMVEQQNRMMGGIGAYPPSHYQQHQPPPPPPPAPVEDGASYYDFGDSDDRMRQFQGVPAKERSLEIKTVRSVKRESQQRQKDRGRRQTPEPIMPSATTSPGGEISSMCHSIASAVWATDRGSAEELSKEERELLTELEHPETVLETDPVLSQFHRSMSLPRNYDRKSSNWHEMKSMYGGQQMQSGPQQTQLGVGQPRKTTEVNAQGAAGKSADDLDMERALRSPHNRLSTPDVVRSTITKKKELRYSEETIDTIFGKPRKINIPERYIPEDTELSENEKAARQKKAEAIKKMLLSETQIAAEIRGETGVPRERKDVRPRETNGGHETTIEGPPAFIRAKVEAEKRHREHMLDLNQALAKEVIERTKIVAARRLSNPSPCGSISGDDQEDSSC